MAQNFATGSRKIWVTSYHATSAPVCPKGAQRRAFLVPLPGNEAWVSVARSRRRNSVGLNANSRAAWIFQAKRVVEDGGTHPIRGW